MPKWIALKHYLYEWTDISIKFNQLLSFDEIGHFAVRVGSSSEVASAGPLAGSSGDDSVSKILTVDAAVRVHVDVPVHDGHQELGKVMIFSKRAAQVPIPDETFVRSVKYRFLSIFQK